MTLRARIALATALAVAVAVVLATVAVYAAASNVLRGQVDDALRSQAADLTRSDAAGGDGDGAFGGPRAGRFGGPGSFLQLIDTKGNVLRLPRSVDALPVSPSAIAVARGGPAAFSTVHVGGSTVRVYTLPLGSGIALQTARPLDEVERSLGRLLRQLVVVAAGGVLVAGLLGLVVARRGLRPVERLAASVEHVAQTRDLAHRIDAQGRDEPARLARAFNGMLASLEEAREAQDRLVADASHELRTPLTALRANTELLALGAPEDVEEHHRLLDDLTRQLDRVGVLVGDLVQLARGARPVADPRPVRLDEVAEDAVARARAFWPDAAFALDTEPVTVEGDADQLARAVDNLVANAVVHGGGSVEVRVRDGALTVRDHGPGVAADDRQRIFARFWRSPAARTTPGSGLGLAIVAQIAPAHGGAVGVDAADGGGARFALRLPVTAG